MMRKVRIALFGVLLVTAASSCKKAEKMEVEIPTSRIVSTLAGAGVRGFINGTGIRTAFNNPQKIASDASGNIYLADMNNHSIRKIAADGVVTTIAGNGERGYADGNGASAQFNSPTGIAVDGNGNLYVADSGNHCIRKISSSGVVSTLAGMAGSGDFADGTGSDARFNYPFDLAVDAANNIFVADINNNRIRKVTPSGVVTTYAGNGQRYFQDGTLLTATVAAPSVITFDSSGNMYVGQSNFIRKITPDGTVKIFAGISGYPDDYAGVGYFDGPDFVAKFFFIYDLTTDKKGNVYVADSDNNLIRKITPDGIVSTYAGIRYTPEGNGKFKDGAADQAYFFRPQGIAVNNEGDIIVAESDRHILRKIAEIPFPDSPDEIARKNWNKPAGWK